MMNYKGFPSGYFVLIPRVEAVSNTSTVVMRVVGGDQEDGMLFEILHNRVRRCGASAVSKEWKNWYGYWYREDRVQGPEPARMNIRYNGCEFHYVGRSQEKQNKKTLALKGLMALVPIFFLPLTIFSLLNMAAAGSSEKFLKM
jgi:hypothetical protein